MSSAIMLSATMCVPEFTTVSENPPSTASNPMPLTYQGNDPINELDVHMDGLQFQNTMGHDSRPMRASRTTRAPRTMRAFYDIPKKFQLWLFKRDRLNVAKEKLIDAFKAMKKAKNALTEARCGGNQAEINKCLECLKRQTALYRWCRQDFASVTHSYTINTRSQTELRLSKRPRRYTGLGFLPGSTKIRGRKTDSYDRRFK